VHAPYHGPFGELGLANFGSVDFTGATVNGSSLGSFNPDEITMQQGGTIRRELLRHMGKRVAPPRRGIFGAPGRDRLTP
jgi:hypothetical protein